MIKYIKQFVNTQKFNPTKLYLILANVVLATFAIWFTNVGLLPFKNLGDFVFFTVLVLILGLYRPSWTFALFIGSLVLENINLAPTKLGINIRPYQFFGFITIISLIVQYFAKRLVFALPKFHWYDCLPLVFALGGFLSALSAINKGATLKQAVIAFSFVSLYFLTRIYVQSSVDLKRVAPFFLSSSVVVLIYGIWQNVRFARGVNAFEVMPGRPNGTFTEADWLGIFLVFLLTAIFTIIYEYACNFERCEESRKVVNSDFKLGILQLRYATLRMTVYYLFLLLIFITLILTVSRSAWLGAVIIVLGYLKITLLYRGKTDHLGIGKGFWREVWGICRQEWYWKEFFQEAGKLIAVLVLSFGIIYLFHLTSFQIGNRAVSTGGLQKITIACQAGSDNFPPQKINSIEELANYGCRHINLEDIEKEKNEGNVVMEVFRPDPNVGIRARIYQQSWQQIKSRPIFGIGWGSISNILGKDDRGAGLNASNIFFETWLGAGIFGILSLVVLFSYLFVVSYEKFVKTQGSDLASIFVLLGLFAIIIPNLFNSGIFLGFVWVFLGVAVSLCKKELK